MIVTHLYHSGTLIELEEHILLFDYYQGQLDIDQNKPLYVFVSHQHYDHYNQDIFHIKHPHITYILSDDIHTQHDCLSMAPHQQKVIDDLKIKTLLSTDLGVAYIVYVENKIIYFAGDLNWWHWKGEPEEDNEYQKITYQKEINTINEPIDIACIVVDQRQEDDYLLGLQYFLDHVKAKYILPIHYFGNYQISDQLKHTKYHNPFQAKILDVKHKHQSFILE